MRGRPVLRSLHPIRRRPGLRQPVGLLQAAALGLPRRLRRAARARRARFDHQAHPQQHQGPGRGSGGAPPSGGRKRDRRRSPRRPVAATDRMGMAITRPRRCRPRPTRRKAALQSCRAAPVRLSATSWSAAFAASPRRSASATPSAALVLTADSTRWCAAATMAASRFFWAIWASASGGAASGCRCRTDSATATRMSSATPDPRKSNGLRLALRRLTSSAGRGRRCAGRRPGPG